MKQRSSVDSKAVHLVFSIAVPLFGITLALLATQSFSYGQGLAAKWGFSKTSGPVAVDSVNGSKDKIEGYYKYVPGVTGTGLRFDGYTTSVVCPADQAPKLHNAFTVEAWVALNTYPWNWVPVVEQERAHQEGYFLGIDAYGHIGLQAEIDGVWETVTSKAELPLKKWAHVVGTYNAAHGLTIYLDGKRVGHLEVHGRMIPARDQDLLMGRARKALVPAPLQTFGTNYPGATLHPKYPVKYSLDGILNDVEIYDRTLSAEEIAKAYAAVKFPSGDVLPWPKLPSGPTGPGRFGAYYTTLHYEAAWDRLRRLGPDSDVVVRFGESPIRLVFWQGASYVPAWVTGNGKWYTDEWLEAGGSGCPDGKDCEPISDKQDRYSRVKILESNNARVMVEWRYALNEVEHYKIAWPDPYTGWGDWADEFWTIYPDGVAIRKQVLWSSALKQGHEWQETIVIDPPGTRPEDNLSYRAITIENMKGQEATYSWFPKGPSSFPNPKDPNIQIVNLKSQWKPFQIVSPRGSSIEPYVGAGYPSEFSKFHWRNHWPVTQIASSGRSAVAPDRPGHTSLSHITWKAYSQHGDTKTKILMDGLTKKSPAELLPLAKSWLSPPKMQVEGAGYRNDGYDPTQRAYVVAWEGQGKPARLKMTLMGSHNSPVYDPAIVIPKWGESNVRVEIDGKTFRQGRTVRVGHVQKLGGAELVVWIQEQTEGPLNISIAPAK